MSVESSTNQHLGYLIDICICTCTLDIVYENQKSDLAIFLLRYRLHIRYFRLFYIHNMYSFVEICCLLERTTDSEAMDAVRSFFYPRGITE